MQQQLRRGMESANLRPIVIDGSNVAMRHGSGQVFSCRGIQIVVDYFKARGHDHIMVFVPEWRKETSRPETPISEQYVLEALEKEKILSYTPSRKINGRRIICYDDRFIVKYANLEGGVIISNDQYRDLMQENPEWRKIIEQRLLQFTFANDHFMPPDDPLGKGGPTLDQFLVKDPRELQGAPKKQGYEPRSNSAPVCPHLGNCTFGRKCRYYHPDREQKQSSSAELHMGGGGGSSGGSHTSSTSSRSATSSPIPDGRGVYSSKNSREDLYLHHSPQQQPSSSSSEELRVERLFADSSSSSSPGGSGLDISELSDKLAQTSLQQTTSPSKLHPHAAAGPAHHLSVKFPVHSSYHHIRSAPVLETTPQGLTLMDGSRPPNHTFPIAQVPQIRVRNGTVTEDHTYHLQTQVHGMPAPQDMGFVPVHSQQQGTLVSRDSRQATYVPGQGMGQRYLQQHHQQQQQQQQQGGGEYGDSRHRVGVVSPSNYPSHHQIMSTTAAATYSDQSLSMHNLHQQHFSPNRQQPPPPSGGPPPPQGGYPAPLMPVPPHHHQHHHHMGGVAPPYQEGSNSFRCNFAAERKNLYHRLVVTLPGCEGRIQHVMQTHPELTSSDLPYLMDLVKKLN